MSLKDYTVIAKSTLPDGRINATITKEGAEYTYLTRRVNGSNVTDGEIIQAVLQAFVDEVDPSNAIKRLNTKVAEIDTIKENTSIEVGSLSQRVETLENKPEDSKLTKALATAVLSPDNITAGEVAVLEPFIPTWSADAEYPKGHLVKYNDDVYVTIMPIEAANTSVPSRAKTSYQKHEKDVTYLDAYGDEIEIQEQGAAVEESSKTAGATPAATDIQ